MSVNTPSKVIQFVPRRNGQGPEPPETPSDRGGMRPTVFVLDCHAEMIFGGFMRGRRIRNLAKQYGGGVERIEDIVRKQLARKVA
jgi:hypothetical protein